MSDYAQRSQNTTLNSAAGYQQAVETRMPDMDALRERFDRMHKHLLDISGNLIGLVSRVYGEGEPPAGGVVGRDKPMSAGAYGAILNQISEMENVVEQIAAKVNRLSGLA